jgi:hypothetical protein
MRADPFFDPSLGRPGINRRKNLAHPAFPGGDLTIDQNPGLVEMGTQPKPRGYVTLVRKEPGEVPGKRPDGGDGLFRLLELTLGPLSQFFPSYHIILPDLQQFRFGGYDMVTGIIRRRPGGRQDELEVSSRQPLK